VGRKGRRRLRSFREMLAQTQVQLERPLRGEAKLEAALAAFDVGVVGRTALDAGAAAGGFTRVLLRHGARRVYAVDAGHGQLLGSLRQDARVVNLEATNLGELGARLVPEPIDLVTLDLSYLAVARAVPQLDRIELRAPDLIALVKPQFELGLERPPAAPAEGLVAAVAGITAAGWRVEDALESPVRGARGAVEFLLWATRPCAHAREAPATGRCPRGSPRGRT
jgi:23S rRNA (cytidine1920-2'-O)/16S rRNA (cytidine1409-2'-O)-methyltransferase